MIWLQDAILEARMGFVVGLLIVAVPCIVVFTLMI